MGNKPIQEDKVKKNIDKIQNVIAVLSGKGGVGKSTVATNIALYLANEGKKVGLLDSDFHGPTIPTLLGMEDAQIIPSPEGLKPVEATKNLKVLSILCNQGFYR